MRPRVLDHLYWVIDHSEREHRSPSAELQPAVQTMLSERGAVAVLPGLHALVVTDEAGVVGRVAGLVGGP